MRKKERLCGRAGCETSCRTGGRYCRSCFAIASRSSHARHRRERNARRRDRAAERDALARMRDSARAKLYVAIARGKMEKGSCAVCGCAEVTAFIADPERWREAIWLCREDRHAEITRRLAAAIPPEQAAIRIQEYDAVRRAVALLPEELRSRLYDIAARGPAGIPLDTDAPLFIMQLIRAYRALPPEEVTVKKPFDQALYAAYRIGQVLWQGFLDGLTFGCELLYTALLRLAPDESG